MPFLVYQRETLEEGVWGHLELILTPPPGRQSIWLRFFQVFLEKNVSTGCERALNLRQASARLSSYWVIRKKKKSNGDIICKEVFYNKETLNALERLLCKNLIK